MKRAKTASAIRVSSKPAGSHLWADITLMGGGYAAQLARFQGKVVLALPRRKTIQQARYDQGALLDLARMARALCILFVCHWLLATSANGGEWKNVGDFTATAYCPCAKCCGVSTGITTLGTKARPGIVAADPKTLPPNTLVRFGNRRADVSFIVEDTGAAIRGRRIDIFCPTHAAALAWGRRAVRVYVWIPADRDQGILAGLGDIASGAGKTVVGLFDLVWKAL